MKFNPNFILKGLDGNPLNFGEGTTEEDTHAGKILAKRMFFSPNQSNPMAAAMLSEDPIKFHTWAVKLYNKQEIDIDKSDVQRIKNLIKQSDLLPVAAAPLLEMLNDLKE